MPLTPEDALAYGVSVTVLETFRQRSGFIAEYARHGLLGISLHERQQVTPRPTVSASKLRLFRKDPVTHVRVEYLVVTRSGVTDRIVHVGVEYREEGHAVNDVLPILLVGQGAGAHPYVVAVGILQGIHYA